MLYFVIFYLLQDVKNDVKISSKNLYIHGMLNLFIFLLHNLFKKQWKWWVQEKAIWFMPYVLMILFLNYFSKKFFKNRLNLIFGLILMGLLCLYEYTSTIESLYRISLFDIHLSYLLFLIGIIIFIIYSFKKKRLDLLIIPISLYAFGLMKETPQWRYLLILFNYQYTLLIPFTQQICKICVEKSKFTNWSLLHQSIIILFLNEPFYQFVVGREEKFSIDAHPMAGRVGMLSHQAHPSFNAFQMGFEKWHLFLLFGIYLWNILFYNSIEEDENNYKKNDSIILIYDEKWRDYTADLIISIITLFFLNAECFLQLQLCFISMNHAFQECVIYLIIAAIYGAMFTGFYLFSLLNL